MGRQVTADLEHALREAVDGEVMFDRLTRRIYSTDASIYSIEPIGVVCPRHADDVVAAVEVAKRFGVPVLPRGAGTSLAGQTVGHAVVLDFSRHMHSLLGIDAEASTARVQPGLVQDELNQAASKHWLDVRAGHVDRQSRHAGRHDRQQLLRLPLGALRHDGRPRGVAAGRAVGWEPGDVRCRGA